MISIRNNGQFVSITASYHVDREFCLVSCPTCRRNRWPRFRRVYAKGTGSRWLRAMGKWAERKGLI